MKDGRRPGKRTRRARVTGRVASKVHSLRRYPKRAIRRLQVSRKLWYTCQTDLPRMKDAAGIPPFLSLCSHNDTKTFLRKTQTHLSEPLQLARRGGHDLLLLLNVAGGGLAVADPADGLQALGEDRVRVVEAGVHPVGVHGGEVLDLQLDEGAAQLLGVAVVLGEGI